MKTVFKHSTVKWVFSTKSYLQTSYWNYTFCTTLLAFKFPYTIISFSPHFCSLKILTCLECRNGCTVHEQVTWNGSYRHFFFSCFISCWNEIQVKVHHLVFVFFHTVQTFFFFSDLMLWHNQAVHCSWFPASDRVIIWYRNYKRVEQMHVSKCTYLHINTCSLKVGLQQHNGDHSRVSDCTSWQLRQFVSSATSQRHQNLQRWKSTP